jgi:hypothetical protein
MKNGNNYLLSKVTIIIYQIVTLEKSNVIKSIDVADIPHTLNENCTKIVKEIGLKTNAIIKVVEANRPYFNWKQNSTRGAAR